VPSSPLAFSAFATPAASSGPALLYNLAGAGSAGSPTLNGQPSLGSGSGSQRLGSAEVSSAGFWSLPGAQPVSPLALNLHSQVLKGGPALKLPASAAPGLSTACRPRGLLLWRNLRRLALQAQPSYTLGNPFSELVPPMLARRPPPPPPEALSRSSTAP
jgi:hypothetical protein